MNWNWKCKTETANLICQTVLTGYIKIPVQIGLSLHFRTRVWDGVLVAVDVPYLASPEGSWVTPHDRCNHSGVLMVNPEVSYQLDMPRKPPEKAFREHPDYTGTTSTGSCSTSSSHCGGPAALWRSFSHLNPKYPHLQGFEQSIQCFSIKYSCVPVH